MNLCYAFQNVIKTAHESEYGLNAVSARNSSKLGALSISHECVCEHLFLATWWYGAFVSIDLSALYICKTIESCDIRQ